MARLSNRGELEDANSNVTNRQRARNVIAGEGGCTLLRGKGFLEGKGDGRVARRGSTQENGRGELCFAHTRARVKARRVLSSRLCSLSLPPPTYFFGLAFAFAAALPSPSSSPAPSRSSVVVSAGALKASSYAGKTCFVRTPFTAFRTPSTICVPHSDAQRRNTQRVCAADVMERGLPGKVSGTGSNGLSRQRRIGSCYHLLGSWSARSGRHREGVHA